VRVTISFLDGALTIAAVMAEPTWFERTFLDLTSEVAARTRSAHQRCSVQPLSTS